MTTNDGEAVYQKQVEKLVGAILNCSTGHGSDETARSAADAIASLVGHRQPSMSLRDRFAGQALAIIAAIPVHEAGEDEGELATQAYAVADAMLAAREASK